MGMIVMGGRQIPVPTIIGRSRSQTTRRSCDECHVEPKLPDCRYVVRRIAVDKLDPHARMSLSKAAAGPRKPEASEEKMPTLMQPSSERPIAATSSAPWL
jgi:hypothetical protein